MESLFLLAFSEEKFLTALAMGSSEAFFNKLLVALPDISGKCAMRAEEFGQLFRSGDQTFTSLGPKTDAAMTNASFAWGILSALPTLSPSGGGCASRVQSLTR
jgi:hypothetical protein